MTKRMLLLAVLVTGVACSKSPAPSTSGTAGKPAATTTSQAAGGGLNKAADVKPVPAELPATIAKVNGEAIGKAEFERAAHQFEARAGQPVPAEKRNEFFRGLLDEMIAMKLLAQQSKALKLTVPESDVDARVKQIQSQFPNEQEFTKALGQQNVTLQQLKDDQRQQMMISKVIETQVAPKVNVDPKEVEAFYAQNPDKFKEPETVRVAHILIMGPQNGDPAAKAKAKAEAEAVLKQIKGGADFATVAKQKSQDPGSAQNGGELPFFARAKDANGQGMVPQFEQASFALTKPNQISPVVETQYGFHIIKLLEKRAPRQVPLEQARPQITEYLKQQQGNQKTAAYIDELKAKSKIEIFI